MSFEPPIFVARPMTPTRFFSDIARPDFLAFEANPDEVRLAMHACTSLSHLIEHIVRYTEKRGSQELREAVFGNSWHSRPTEQSKLQNWISKQILQSKLALPEPIREAQKICESVAVSYKHLYVENTHLHLVSGGSTILGAGLYERAVSVSDATEPPDPQSLHVIEEAEVEVADETHLPSFSARLVLPTRMNESSDTRRETVEILPHARVLHDHFLNFLSNYWEHFRNDDEYENTWKFEEIMSEVSLTGDH